MLVNIDAFVQSFHLFRRGGGTNSRFIIVNKGFVASTLSCTEHIACQEGTNPEQMNNIVKVFYLFYK